MRARKTRHQFYLPDAFSAELEHYAARPDLPNIDILTQAMTSWFHRQNGEALNRQYGPAIERILRELPITQHRVDANTELLEIFARHQLTLVSHHPPFDEDTGVRGQQMFRRLLSLVEQRLGEGGVADGSVPPLPLPEMTHERC